MIAIDLGSNTIRCIEFDGTVWGKSYEKIVRTAEGLHETDRIGENAIRRIAEAIDEARNVIDFSGQDVVAYTTAAMRLASNSQEALQKIQQQSSVTFRIIDADKEAALTLAAVRYRLSKLGLTPAAFYLVDIGGGSTELIHWKNGSSSTISINTGIVTLSERSSSEAQLRRNIDRFRGEVEEMITSQRSEKLVLTAGTPTTIAAYVNGMDYQSYDPRIINGKVLTLGECYRTFEELMAMDESTRSRYVGVGRENLIMAGILMVTAIYEAMGCDNAIVIDDGLREGIALEYFNLH